MFPENGNSGGGTNGILAMLPALMQQRGVDPNILALMGNGNNRNGNGWGDDLFAILLLFILMGWGGFGGMMGNGQGGVVPFVQNDANTAVIMQAVQRNGYDIQSLATALNTSSDAVQAAINGLGMQICNIGNQMGMNTNQIVTAIMQGNNAIQSQICQCCCQTNENITKMGYENQLSVCNQTNALVNTANQNTLALRDAGTANTNAIISKLDAMQNQALLDKIDSLREKNSTLVNQLSQEHQNAYFAQVSAQTIAPVNAALGDLSARLAKIECNQPEVAKVPYSPVVGIPTCVAAQYGLGYGFNPYAAGNGFWG